MTEPDDSGTELPDIVAERVLRVPGVVDLHGGPFGEVGTYLPGRRLAGVRVGEDRVDVHVVMEWGRQVQTLATKVRSAVAEVAPGRQVSVTVEDIAVADEDVESAADGAG